MGRLDEALRQAQVVWEKLPSIFLWGHDSTGWWFAVTLLAHVLAFGFAILAVSYLVIWLAGLFFDLKTPPSRHPVSYTHLDVYKRQAYGND